MKKVVSATTCLVTLGIAFQARAADYYASPSGTGSTCSQAAPCSANTAQGKTVAGDTVHLAGGTYSGGLRTTKSGTASAWITFTASEAALPIFQGGGVGSATSTYVRFIGIVSRGTESGFSNGWTGQGTTNSNGHFEYINCIADGNSRNGFAHNSSQGVLIRESISAHNGNSANSWSSGVQLYQVQGTPADNVVERSVAFENVDMQNHSDGSGFIVDENCTGATFRNNIAFRNGGSCIRLTKSANTHIINNSCYHDALDSQATGPSNPGEIYWSDATSRNGAVVINNLAAAAGHNNQMQAFVNPPGSGLSNNLLVNTNGATPFFTDPAGNNPDLRLPQSATNAINMGTATNAPTTDIGFDPKCIKKGSPGGLSWWQYVVDYTYIASIGGVGACWRPGTRTGAPDIGAYEYGATPAGGAGGFGGASGSGSGGAPSAGQGGTPSAGTGGTTGGASTAGNGGVSTAGAGGESTAGNGGVSSAGTSTAGGAAGTDPGGSGTTGTGGAVTGGVGGAGGLAASGGADAAGGTAAGGAATGGSDVGTAGTGVIPTAGQPGGGASGVAGTPSTAGTLGASGETSAAGAFPTAGASSTAGTTSNPTGGSSSVAGSPGAAGSGAAGRAGSGTGGRTTNTGGSGYYDDVPALDDASCTCRTAPAKGHYAGLLALIPFAALAWRRRRRS